MIAVDKRDIDDKSKIDELIGFIIIADFRKFTRVLIDNLFGKNKSLSTHISSQST